MWAGPQQEEIYQQLDTSLSNAPQQGQKTDDDDNDDGRERDGGHANSDLCREGEESDCDGGDDFEEKV